MLIHILGTSLLIMIASLVGVFSTWRVFGRVVEKQLKYLVSFSAGVFAVIAYTLSYESFENGGVEGLLWLAGGAVFVLVLFKLLPGFHHHHGEECHGDECGVSSINPRRVLLGDAVHNIGDGILLTTSFLINPALGFLTSVSIFFHELIQELSEFFVLREAGYGVKKALTLNFLASTTLLLGSVGSFFLLQTFAFLEIPFIGIAAGSFVVIVLFDLIPHSVRHVRLHKTYGKHFIYFLLGLVLMMGVYTATSEGHVHGEHDDHHEEEHEEDHGDGVDPDSVRGHGLQ